jgi:ribosomal protein S18 acetylase RimI-like enzyme
MESDPFEPYGLTPVTLDHQSWFGSFFDTTSVPLSDYSFAATFLWRDAIHVRWRILRDHLCLFANGTNGLTLVAPPLGSGAFVVALREAVDLARQYNADHGIIGNAAVEYVSSDLRETFPRDYTAEPLSGDYIYPTRQLIELDAPALRHKRRDCRRFETRYAGCVEPFGDAHRDACIRLLRQWNEEHEDSDDPAGQAIRDKRNKDMQSSIEALKHYQALGLTGMVLRVGPEIIGFTFGERLRADMCSILIEKTDRAYAGSAQFIYREFCRNCWGDLAWCNAGDDWSIPSLAWNKQSYQPAFRLAKWRMIPPPARRSVVVAKTPTMRANDYGVECAAPEDLGELVRLERECFSPDEAFGRSQFRRLLRNDRANVFVIRRGGRIVGDAVLLRRQSPAGPVCRLYSLAVGAAFRGNGMGAALLDACLQHMRQIESQRISLEVLDSNVPACRLYREKGFYPGKQLPDYYGPGLHGRKMRLLLTPETTPDRMHELAGTTE